MNPARSSRETFGKGIARFPVGQMKTQLRVSGALKIIEFRHIRLEMIK